MVKSRPQLRRDYIKKFYLEKGYIPSTKSLAEKFHAKIRAINKDIEAVVNEVTDPDLVGQIRRKFLDELNDRMPEMSDKDFVKLTRHFLATKTEVEAKGDMNFTLQAWRPGSEDEEDDEEEEEIELEDMPEEGDEAEE